MTLGEVLRRLYLIRHNFFGGGSCDISLELKMYQDEISELIKDIEDETIRDIPCGITYSRFHVEQ